MTVHIEDTHAGERRRIKPNSIKVWIVLIVVKTENLDVYLR